MSVAPSGARPEVVAARRVVVKVGSSSLTTAAGGIDPDRVRALVDVVESGRAPYLLVLGNDASDGIRGALDALHADLVHVQFAPSAYGYSPSVGWLPSVLPRMP